MKFSDIVKFDSDSPREPGIIKGDFQGDMIDPETLEKAVYDYVEESRDGGEMHKRLGVATLIESIVFTKEKMSALGIPDGTIPEGWWVGFRVSDPDVWEKVKAKCSPSRELERESRLDFEHNSYVEGS